MQEQDRMAGYALDDKERAIAEEIGKHVVARILAAAQDKEIAGHVIGTYTSELQMILGRGVLRLFGYLIGVVMLIATFKLGLADKIADFFSRGP